MVGDMESCTVRPSIPKLSKSRFMAGLQCHKRLYLESYAHDLMPAIDPFTQSLLDTGAAVGALARSRFPDGVLIDDDHLHHEVAEERTRLALADATVPAIYEAAFTWDDVRVRADILVRVSGDVFDLVEVKSTTWPKLEHEWDLAVQLAVLEGAGVRVHRAFLMHLDRSFVYPGGDYDLRRLFACADLTETARGRQREVLGNLDAMRATLWGEEPPAIEVGPHCERPHTCPFFDRCHDGLPADPLLQLPKGRWLRDRLAVAGIVGFDDIPLDFPGLSLHQRRALEAIRSGERFCDPAIREVLAGVVLPVHFIDFETIMPALPLYPGTRPYETIPVQWSDHVLHEDGRIDHCEYLYDGQGDPRRPFAESLLEMLGSCGTIVVYSNYEAMRLGDLAAWLPGLADEIARVQPRILDLLAVIRRHVYDQAFNGSFSLKSVLPALVPSLGYGDLAIQDGGVASLALREVMDPATQAERRFELRGQLLAYCGRDTEALVGLFQLLR
jgi:Domain of unknown function(DUF2779)